MNDYKQQVTDFFNRRTAYDQEGTFHPHLANLLLECVQIQPGQEVLDIATGTGLIAIPAAQKVGATGHVVGLDIATGTGLIAIPAAQKVGATGHVVGVDMSTGMLSQARQKITAIGLQNIELMEADVECLDFNHESFDIIFCSSALVYLTDIPAAFKNWYRFLKPRGVIAFSCFSEASFIAPIIMRACAKHGVGLLNINEPLGTPEKCHHLLQQAGFSNIEVKTEQLGEYLSLGDRRLQWDGQQWFHPTGNPLLQLSPQQLQQLQAEYKAEVAKLVTAQGVWYDVTTFLVTARK